MSISKINYDDFMPEFENQNPQYKWNDIQVRKVSINFLFFPLLLKLFSFFIGQNIQYDTKSF
jgi:hypothetical protein